MRGPVGIRNARPFLPFLRNVKPTAVPAMDSNLVARVLRLVFAFGLVGVAATNAMAQEFLPLSADVFPGYVEMKSSARVTSATAGWTRETVPPLAFDGIALGNVVRNTTVTPIERPNHVVLSAELASWDADLEPDGWRCRLQLLDSNDLPAAMVTANARFELRLRVPRRDRSGFNDMITEKIQWSQRLQWDEFAVSEVKLPLRKSLPSFYTDGNGPSRLAGSRRSSSIRQQNVSDRIQDIRLAAGDGLALSNSRPHPGYGVIVVRVNVPGVGTLEAIDPVLADEPLLVDSHWPQR